MIRAVDERLVFNLGLIVAILVLNAVLDYRNTRELKEDMDWFSHFRAVQESLDLALLSLGGAETGQRGYLLTSWFSPHRRRKKTSFVPTSSMPTAMLRNLWISTGFLHIVATIEEFWLSVVKLPKRVG
jgi:hypothetical protein